MVIPLKYIELKHSHHKQNRKTQRTAELGKAKGTNALTFKAEKNVSDLHT